MSPWARKAIVRNTVSKGQTFLTPAETTAFIVERLQPSEDERRRTEDRVRKLIASAVDAKALAPSTSGWFDKAKVIAGAQSKKTLKVAFPDGSGGAEATLLPATAHAEGFEAPTTIAAGLAALGDERERRRRVEKENEDLRKAVARLRPLEEGAAQKRRKASVAGGKGLGVPRRKRG